VTPASQPDPFAALGDPHRRSIVEALSEGEKSVQELADVVPISRPAVSRHLRLLKDAGLVSDRPVGAKRFYRLEAAGIAEAWAFMEEVWGSAASRFKIAAENIEIEEE
jgi:DNA-binding transcriptional ArsR family regulator